MADLFIKRRETLTGGKKVAEEDKASGASIVLSPAEAEEYCVFKRQKRVEEVLTALKKTVLAPEKDLSAGEIKKCAESARAAHAIAVRVPPNKACLLRTCSAATPGRGISFAAMAGMNLW